MALDEKYRDDLLVALRAYEISGERVGDVLAEVEAHVRETGEDPVEAFGTPRTYAAQVVAQLDRRTGKPSTLEFAAVGLGIAALTMAGSDYLIDGLLADAATVPYTLKDTVALPVLMVLLPLAGTLLFKASTTRNRLYAIAAVAALAVALVSQFAAGLLFDDVTPLYELPRWGAIGLGAILLAGAAGLLIRMIRRGRVVYPTVDRPAP